MLRFELTETSSHACYTHDTWRALRASPLCQTSLQQPRRLCNTSVAGLVCQSLSGRSKRNASVLRSQENDREAARNERRTLEALAHRNSVGSLTSLA